MRPTSITLRQSSGFKIRERRGRHLDRAVDEAIGGAERRDRALHGGLAVGRIAHVGLLEDGRVADLRGQRAPALRVDVGEHDTAAALHEAARHRLADAARPAGDDQDLAVELRHVDCARTCLKRA